MTAVEAPEHKVVLYKSADLKDWTAAERVRAGQRHRRRWECPDLFPLAVDGDPKTSNGSWSSTSTPAAWPAAPPASTSWATSTAPRSPPKPRNPCHAPAGTVLAGFNDGTYNGWTVNNEPGNWKNGPFGDTPATGALPGQSPVTGFDGSGLINSFNDGDWPSGPCSHPNFTVTDDYLNFLVGGGKHPRVSDKLDNTPPEGELKFDGFEVPPGPHWPTPAGPEPGTCTPNFQPSTSGGDFYIGAKRINTFDTGTAPGDDRQGTLTSPEFPITKNFMSMLVGGGNRSGGLRTDPGRPAAHQRQRGPLPWPETMPGS